MKSIVAAVAVLFLVSTFAMAEGYQPLPFPQAANPAMAAAHGSSSMPAEMPASMASNQGASSAASPTGSPFPSIANPSNGADTSAQSTPATDHQHDLGSPFPADASTAQNW
jgi:hypothetical protein